MDRYALLFSLGAGDAAPLFATVPEHRIKALQDEGFFLLGTDSEVQAQAIEDVRAEEERRWNTPRWRTGTTGE